MLYVIRVITIISDVLEAYIACFIKAQNSCGLGTPCIHHYISNLPSWILSLITCPTFFSTLSSRGVWLEVLLGVCHPFAEPRLVTLWSHITWLQMSPGITEVCSKTFRNIYSRWMIQPRYRGIWIRFSPRRHTVVRRFCCKPLLTRSTLRYRGLKFFPDTVPSNWFSLIWVHISIPTIVRP